MSQPSTLLTPRIAIMVVYAAFGSAVGALAGAMPEVIRTIRIDDVSLGLAMALSTLATVAAMSLGGRIAHTMSNRAVLLSALPLFAVLLLCLLTATSQAAFFTAFMLLGLLFGLTDLFMNAEGTAIEHDMKRPVFTMFHASVSAATAIFAVASSFVAVMAGPWLVGVISMVMFALAWGLVFRNVPARSPVAKRLPAGTGSASRRPLVLLGLAAGLIIAAETAALLWSAKLLDDLAPALAAISGLGAAFYGVCNASLRVIGDRLRVRYGDLRLMTWSLIVAICGFSVLGLSKSFTLSVAAFAIVGLGTAVLIPCVFAVAAAHAPHRRAASLSFVALLSGVPRILAPWGFGWAASAMGTGGAFGLLAVGLSAALAVIIVLRRGT
jgi:MFS family permease